MLLQRVLTALVLAPLMLAGIYLLSPPLFSVFIGVIVMIAAWEWFNLAGYSRMLMRWVFVTLSALVLLGLWWLAEQSSLSWTYLTIAALLWWVLALVLVLTYPGSQSLIAQPGVRLMLFVPVMVPLWLGLNLIKARPDATLMLTWLMLLVWGADIGAYFAGRAFGRRKLAPNVSPGKTWAGVYGGMATSMLISTGLAMLFIPALSAVQWLLLLLFSALVVAISVLGDLVESLLKRLRGIKDSSSLLPGHGGVLDRVDSLCAATPMFVLMLVLVAL
ncbi:MAG: phosphatidate cytidylyltransferase [Saccharospirillum sp.]|nr:phosphatidate cytidylyltransferase [Saccharospirillum sp.]